MNNELFSKEMKPTVAADNVIDDDSGDDGATAGEELKDADFDDEDSDFDLSVSDDDLEDEE
jgi:hypothetical protein